MAEPFTAFTNDPRPLTDLSRAQVGLILGLNNIVREMGVVLVCPRCAADGHFDLDTQNTPDG